MSTQATTWTAQSKTRKNVFLQGKARGNHKTILRGVKEKLSVLTKKNKVKDGEPFKVSLLKDGTTLDAWVLKAKGEKKMAKKNTASRAKTKTGSKKKAARPTTRKAVSKAK